MSRNPYAGFDPGVDIPADEPLDGAEPLPPLRGHSLVPRPQLRDALTREQAARALLTEAGALLERFAPDLPRTHVTSPSYLDRCLSCDAPVTTERGPDTGRGLCEWAKDATPHVPGCTWVRARELISRLHQEETP